MARSFKELRAKMPAKAQALSMGKANQILKKMALQEIRQVRKLSQEELATILKMKQANISRIENGSDMYISTLRSYIEGMGGKLNIIAHFPEGDISII